jgi:hypothetical protein
MVTTGKTPYNLAEVFVKPLRKVPQPRQRADGCGYETQPGNGVATAFLALQNPCETTD